MDQSDEEGIVSVGDKFVYSDEEGGDSTLTVRRIVRGGIVYLWHSIPLFFYICPPPSPLETHNFLI